MGGTNERENVQAGVEACFGRPSQATRADRFSPGTCCADQRVACAFFERRRAGTEGAGAASVAVTAETMTRPSTRQAPRRWYALRDAAVLLAMTPAALRKQLERHARPAGDGGTEATVDGVRARKFANRWRVSFDETWTQ